MIVYRNIDAPSSPPLPEKTPSVPVNGRETLKRMEVASAEVLEKSRLEQQKIHEDLFAARLLAGESSPFSKEQKAFFFRSVWMISNEKLLQWLQDLSPFQVQSLSAGTPQQFKGILKRLDTTIWQEQVGKTIKDFIGTISTQTDKLSEKTLSLYSSLEGNLSKSFRGLTIEEFFMKLYIKESSGNKKSRDINLFAASGTWSLWLSQSTGFAYLNSKKGNLYNPFNPDEAIPGSIKHFLLEAYAYTRGQWRLRVARALDIYNKWPGWTQVVPDEALLSSVNTWKDKYGNPYNYAFQVLST
jgi:hypothetical protein